MTAIGRARLATMLFSPPQALGSHQAGTATFAGPSPLLTQILENTWNPIGATTGLMEFHDLLGQGLVMPLAGTGSLLGKAVVPAG